MNTTLSADQLFAIRDPAELRAQARWVYTQLFRAGEGYSLGGEYASVDDLADELGGELIAFGGDGGIAIYRTPDGRAVLVSEEDDGVWAIDVLPFSARDEMDRPGGHLVDDADYEALQRAAESVEVEGDMPAPIDRVLGGPEADDEGDLPRIGDPVEDSELPTAAADIVRDLMSEAEDARKSFPDALDEETERRVFRTLDQRDETDRVERADEEEREDEGEARPSDR